MLACDVKLIQHVPSIPLVNIQKHGWEELLTLYSANHLQSLILVLIRLQPFLRMK